MASKRGTDRSLEGRICLVTGANTGIGRPTAVELARRGARVWLACRSRERTQPVLDEISELGGPGGAEFLELDLGSLEATRRAAQTFLASGESLDLLINNAGLAGPKGKTVDGFEMAFGVNHLGHFLLTLLLLEGLAAKPSRIVNVSSRAHTRVKRIDYAAVQEPTKTRTGLYEYCMSKLANVLFSAELGRRLAGTGCNLYSLHPGGIASEIWRDVPTPLRQILLLFLRTPEDGARTTLYCATDPKLDAETGLYYANCRRKKHNRVVDDPAAADELWNRSIEWTGAPWAD